MVPPTYIVSYHLKFMTLLTFTPPPPPEYPVPYHSARVHAGHRYHTPHGCCYGTGGHRSRTLTCLTSTPQVALAWSFKGLIVPYFVHTSRVLVRLPSGPAQELTRTSVPSGGDPVTALHWHCCMESVHCA